MPIASDINRFLIDAIGTVTSREKLRGLFRVPFYSNAFSLAANGVVISLLGFVFWIMAARLYPVSDVGLASAIIAAMGLLTYLSTLGLQFGLIRFLPSAPDRVGMLNSCFTIAAVVALVTAGIFLVGLPLWSPTLLFIQQQPIFLICFILFTIVNAVGLLINNAYAAERRASFTFISGVTSSILKLLLVIGLAAFFGTFGIFASVGIAVSVTMLLGLLWFLPKVQPGYRPFPTIRRQAVNELVHYSLGNYLAHSFWILPGTLLPLMVLNILGAEPNAYFAIAWAIAAVLPTLSVAISTSLFVEGSYSQELLLSYTKRALGLTLLIFVPAIIIIFTLGDKILWLFGQAYSQNATTLLWILAVAMLPVSINYLYVTINRVTKNTKNVIIVSVAVCLLTTGLSYLLMRGLGLIGVGIGYLVGQSVVAAGIALSLFRHRRAKART